MKRLLVVVLIILSIVIACIYMFIPTEIKISAIVVVRANERAVYRSLIDEQNWIKWWPGKKEKNDEKNIEEFFFNDYSYKTGTTAYGIEVIISDDGLSSSSLMRLLPLSLDSVAINWTLAQTTSANPFDKLSKYFKAKHLKSDMQQILSHAKSYSQVTQNLYTIDIKPTTVTDTLLMVKKSVQKEKPSISSIYAHINDVSAYISANNAVETNRPMLNITERNDIKSYEVMVAIPVNKRMQGNGSVMLKRMVAGNILYADVKGGEATIEAAMKQMENYAADYQKSSPALPFQLLVTDRTKETDTANWITRLYYPIL